MNNNILKPKQDIVSSQKSVLGIESKKKLVLGHCQYLINLELQKGQNGGFLGLDERKLIEKYLSF
ncbi:hypothetical protein KAZ01_02360 [Candidatus Gracilibacteria bacterium]|nr:hypothetical protein [Candidatus Gracilibacteria bacterium]